MTGAVTPKLLPAPTPLAKRVNYGDYALYLDLLADGAERAGVEIWSGKAFPPGYLHETWRDWLYWDVELEA